MNQKLQKTLPELRQHLKQLRQQISAKEQDRNALIMRGRLFTWLASNRTTLAAAGMPDIKHIAAFWATQNEPVLEPLLRQWDRDHAIKISLPVIAAKNQPLAWRQWQCSTQMQTGPFNIQEPIGKDLEITDLPEIVLVPTLGFTRLGDRLGYGGGFYDRTLAAWQARGHKFFTLGLAWSSGDLSSYDYQAAAHDIRLDAILTDKGWAKPAPDLDLFFET